MLNTITLQGRLVRDADLRRTREGTGVCNFRLAVARDIGDATDFIDIVAWRQQAEFAGKYCTKGRMVIVTGRLQMREWKDPKTGDRRISAEVLADRLYFSDEKRADIQNGELHMEKGKPFSYPEFEELNEEDGELPF